MSKKCLPKRFSIRLTVTEISAKNEIYFSISIPIMKHPVLSSSDFMVDNIKKCKTNINNSNVVK